MNKKIFFALIIKIILSARSVGSTKRGLSLVLRTPYVCLYPYGVCMYINTYVYLATYMIY